MVVGRGGKYRVGIVRSRSVPPTHVGLRADLRRVR